MTYDDLKQAKYKYWRILRDFSRDSGLKGQPMYEALEKKYGVKPKLDPIGNITDDYEVTNEKKYMLFVLGYGADNLPK